MGNATSLMSSDSAGTIHNLNNRASVIELQAAGAQRHHSSEQHVRESNTNKCDFICVADYSANSDPELVHQHDVIGDHHGGDQSTAMVRHQQHQQEPGRLKRPKVRIIEPHARSPFLPKSPLLHLHRYSPLGFERLVPSASPTPSFGFDGAESSLAQDAFGEEWEHQRDVHMNERDDC